ncbi:hypothetical protein MHYP_G00069180 [Metynnis hypsauchen]
MAITQRQVKSSTDRYKETSRDTHTPAQVLCGMSQCPFGRDSEGVHVCLHPLAQLTWMDRGNTMNDPDPN